jgi:hypothetical protein
MGRMSYRHGTRDPYLRIVLETHAPGALLASDAVGRGMREKGVARKLFFAPKKSLQSRRASADIANRR